MIRHIVFSPEAEEQLVELHRYIAIANSPEVAADFTEAIVAYCEGLAEFPHRGTDRSYIRPGLRTASFRKRTTIAFAILDETLAIVGVFYGGRDFESILRQSSTAEDEPPE